MRRYILEENPLFKDIVVDFLDGTGALGSWEGSDSTGVSDLIVLSISEYRPGVAVHFEI